MKDFSGHLGVTLRDERHILVHQDLEWNAHLLVLAHEASHLLHPPTLSDAESEVFVEGVSLRVGRRLYGRFADEAHRRYLTRYKGQLSVWKTFSADIDHAVRLLAPPSRAARHQEVFLPEVDLEDRSGNPRRGHEVMHEE